MADAAANLDLARLDTPEAARYVARAMIAPGVWLGWSFAVGFFQMAVEVLRNHAATSTSTIIWAAAIIALLLLLTALAWFVVSRIAGVLLLLAALAAEVQTAIVTPSLALIVGGIAIFLGAAGVRGAFVWHHFQHKNRLVAQAG